MTGQTHLLLQQLAALRAELADLAYTLERRGRLDAADVAVTISARIAELRDELAAPDSEPVRLERN